MEEKPGQCVYTKYLVCDRYASRMTECTDKYCGWNPDVKLQRLMKIWDGGLEEGEDGLKRLYVPRNPEKPEKTEQEVQSDEPV